MARATFGETLQDLFRDHELGRIPTAEFEIRRRALLMRSKCWLPAFVPDWRRELVLTVLGAAIGTVTMFVLNG